jgi:ankyrin repeat protein
MNDTHLNGNLLNGSRVSTLRWCSFRGDTAMHFAATGGKVDAVQKLLAAGAKVDVANRNGALGRQTPFPDGHAIHG